MKYFKTSITVPADLSNFHLYLQDAEYGAITSTETTVSTKGC